MDILICHSCGSIIRGKSKFCTGCGTHTLATAAQNLAVLTQASIPLACTINPDPMVLEEAILQHEYGGASTNGGNGHSEPSEIAVGEDGTAITFEAVLPEKPSGPQPASVLSVVLGRANTPPPTQAQGGSVSDLLSMMESMEGKPESTAEASEFDPPPADEFGQAKPKENVIDENYQPPPPGLSHIPEWNTDPQEFDVHTPAELPPSEPEAPETNQAQFEAEGAEETNPERHALINQLFGPTEDAQAPLASAESTPRDQGIPTNQPLDKSKREAFDFFAPSGGTTQVSPTAAPPSAALDPPEPAPQNPTEPDQSTPSAKAAKPQALDFFAQAPLPSPVVSDSFVDDQELIAKFEAESRTEEKSSSQPASNTPSFATNQMPDMGSMPGAISGKGQPAPAPSGAPDVSLARPNDPRSVDPAPSEKSRHDEVGILARRARNKQTQHKDVEEKAPGGPFDFLEGELELAGQSFPKKAVIGGLAVLALIIIPLFFMLVGSVGTAVTDMVASQQAQQMPPLTGQWEFAFQTGDKVHRGKLILQQTGQEIRGNGRDQEYFEFAGKLDGSHITFKKQYVIQGQPVGKAVLWEGSIKLKPNSPPFISGVYKQQIATGVFRLRKVIEVTGRWEARMTQSIAQADLKMQKATNSPVTDFKSGDEKIKETQDMFLKIAIGIVIFCVLLAMGSLKLFGPSGLINIWAKKEYIPSQFRSQHNKMLRELGKPPRPGGMPLGPRQDWGLHQVFNPQKLALTPEMRESNPHMLVIGAGAKGKSRLIASMICHDIISADRAVIVIDSDGGLADLLVDWIASHPKGRELSQRVILLDPTHKGNCPAYNPLEAPEDGDLQAAASAVVYGFKAIYTEPPGAQSQWNQQTANILRNSALLLMANNRTLIDLPTLLSDNDFRDVMLEKIERLKAEKVEYITLLETWGQYKRLARTDQWINWVEPILNRVSPMLSDPRIRPILTKPQGELNLRKIIKEEKILICKIPQGELDQNANLLGSLIVTGIKQAALSLSQGKATTSPCALYLDEFDSFIEKETIDAITSDTKKLQIGLIAACKSLQHLPEDFRNQLIIHIGTLFAFSLAKKDADMLGPQMFRVDGRKIKHQTIQNIFNKVNSTPQFELISDEEKLNIDRLVGQEERTFFCYRVGTVAGVFHLKSPDFKDIPDNQVNWSLVEQMYTTPGIN